MSAQSRRWTIGVVLAGLALGGGGVWLLTRRPPPPPPATGIPQSLAEERAARVSNLAYALSLSVPERRRDPVRGRVIVSFSLKDARRPLAFDFAPGADHVSALLANGRSVAVGAANGHLVLPARRLKEGANRIELEFTAGDASLNRSDDFLYTLFVPARASLAFPCFDQPDLKARWTIGLEIPSGWVALSNGAEVGRESRAGRVRLAFAETPPLPTYLVAIAAGKFSIETAQRDGRTFRMFDRETDAAKVARNRDAIFDLHARALRWMQDYTGIAYPFGKFDFVLLPAFQFSGMEHPGAIYYSASALLLDRSATQNQSLNRANTIAHETAHMWFGDLVTMRWFNDVWMKEVFASFMAAKIVNPSFPDVNHDLRFLLQNYPAAYDVDRTAGANPIRQPLANLNDAGTLYGAIIYQKAPIVMRQLEQIVGPVAFRDGLRAYLRRFQFANASWPDLIALLDERTPADLASWSHAWVDEPGRPTVRIDLQVSAGRIAQLSLEQDDSQTPLVWPQRFELRMDGSDPIPVDLDSRETDLPAARQRPAPRWMVPVGGYGLFDLDANTLEYLSRSLVRIQDPYARGTALVDLWEAMLEGQVAAGRLIDDLLVALRREPDELLVQQMLDDVQVAFWRFTAADDRPAVAHRIETVLRAGLAGARSTSLKAAWFAALRRTATTPETLAWLAAVWRHDASIEGLPLSPEDETDLAADLALRGAPDAGERLHAQLERLTNPDRRARFAFILPALSNDTAERDAFFERLRDVSGRQHEAWVLDAVRYLHHPLRAGSSRKYVRSALELTREIQQTGDIFFPKRWLDATLSGYQTVQTAADVRRFIDELPADYPPRLKLALLASADPLFRAAQLLNQ